MIPSFDGRGNVPPGVHWASWKEFAGRFGWNGHRRMLLDGLKVAIANLRDSGCKAVYIDGSFVTAKETPADFDACWSITGVDPRLLDPVLLDFANERAAQKAKFHGEMFPAEIPEGISGKTFLEFFQTDKTTGRRKGIIAIRLRRTKL
jgi:hypothetical protein